MSQIVDLGVSFFDPDFTLNPEKYLADLYSRDDVFGFHSEGMDFIFKFKQGREVMFNKNFIRGYSSDDGLVQREARYTEQYPWRARQFANNYSGQGAAPDLKFKTLVVRFIGEVAERASFEYVEPIFTRLADGGRVDNYLDAIATVPLRVFLSTAGIPYDEGDINGLYEDGCSFVKAFENAANEEAIAEADAAIKNLWDFVEQRYSQFADDSLIAQFVRDGYAMGLTQDNLSAVIGGIFLVSLANTIGISSTYLLRNLIRYRGAADTLRKNPALVQKDNTVIEFLRRDNHVKALSRHVNESCMLDGFELAAGRNINLFFPGINLDPAHWDRPLELDFTRNFEGDNNIVFGGSLFMCVGRKLGMAFIKHMLEGFLRYLPASAEIVEEEMEMDGSWVAERIIQKMPIVLN